MTDRTDGLSNEFDELWFDLRASNTEPIIRLSVESRGTPVLMQRKVDEMLDLLEKLD